MKTTFKICALTFSLIGLSACGIGNATNFDYGVDQDSLSRMEPGIWVDSNGCDHWIIDDGIEGYMTPRKTPDGRPVCRAGAVPHSVTNFKRSFYGTAVR